MTRGFTLVELAIVVVIAGILAAIATPIYQNVIEDSKWSEGKSAVSTVRKAIDVFKAKKSNNCSEIAGPAMGLLDTVTIGNQSMTLAEALRIDNSQFDSLKYFDADDIVISIAAGGDFVITITADPINNPEAPPTGSYSLAQDGEESGP